MIKSRFVSWTYPDCQPAPYIGECITANEVNLCLSIQTFQECVHSQSYSYIRLDTICNPTERDAIPISGRMMNTFLQKTPLSWELL